MGSLKNPPVDEVVHSRVREKTESRVGHGMGEAVKPDCYLDSYCSLHLHPPSHHQVRPFNPSVFGASLEDITEHETAKFPGHHGINTMGGGDTQ